MKYSIATASYSQKGMREKQEDSLYPTQPTSSDRLFVVCDGVGGSPNGEQASSAVCKRLAETLTPYIKNGNMPTDDVLQTVIRDLSYHLQQNNINGATTMTLLILGNDGVLTAHIGDSRIYHFRPNSGMVSHTKDHSLVQSFVDAGMMSEEEARQHPKSNIITRAIRATTDNQDISLPDICRTKDIRKGDIFLLCTDGVWGTLTATQLTTAVLQPQPLEQKTQSLAALTADSHDNNTATLIEITDIHRHRWQDFLFT